MGVQYRPARAEEMPKFTWASAVGFGNSTAEERLERLRTRAALPHDWTLAAWEDGEPVAQMATVPFSMRWNGRDIPCGGVTAVTTLPSHRRRGHLRELMTRSFGTMRDAGQPVAMLWASMAAIYQRFGYGIACTRHLCDLDPRHVRFVDEAPTPGRVRMLKAAEARPFVERAYRRFAAPRTLMLARDEEPDWNRRVFTSWDQSRPPFLVATYEEAGETLGYIVYEVAQHGEMRPGPDQRLIVYELIWLSLAAHRALVRYLIGHDLADSVQMWKLPVDDPLFWHVQEPRLLNMRAYDGTLVRIVDVAPALEGRGYDADGRLTFSLTDDMCPWNTGAWELTVEGGAARVKPAIGDAEMRLTPRVLAILASGYQPATTLARIGLIPPADARALRVCDDLFRTSHAPFCMDDF